MRYIVFVIIILLCTVLWFVYSGLKMVGINQGYAPTQPIAFSHKLHAGDNEIACIYCHSGAERSRHAGIPAPSVCLNCHTKIKKDSPEIKKIADAVQNNKPIEWVKVHRLADFVFFSHERHAGIGKIKCQECHGPVETMVTMKQQENLTMGWCINCHREKEILVPGTEKIVKVADPEIGGLDCAKCHM